jgi:ParB/RepB/Spo0J family partition protein
MASQPITPTTAEIATSNLEIDDLSFMFRANLRVGDLRASIASEGQQSPIIVRQGASKGHYQIISGFHRATAMRQLGLETISAIVRSALQRCSTATAALGAK